MIIQHKLEEPSLSACTDTWTWTLFPLPSVSVPYIWKFFRASTFKQVNMSTPHRKQKILKREAISEVLLSSVKPCVHKKVSFVKTFTRISPATSLSFHCIGIIIFISYGQEGEEIGLPFSPVCTIS